MSKGRAAGNYFAWALRLEEACWQAGMPWLQTPGLGRSGLLSRSFEAEGREPADGSVDRVDAGGHGIEHLDRGQAPRRELLQELLDAEL